MYLMALRSAVHRAIHVKVEMLMTLVTRESYENPITTAAMLRQ